MSPREASALVIPAKIPTLFTHSEVMHPPHSLLFFNSFLVPLFPVVHQFDQCPRNIIAQVSLKYGVSTRLQQLLYLCLGLTHRHSEKSHKLDEVLVVLVLDDEYVWGDGTQVSQVLL